MREQKTKTRTSPGHNDSGGKEAAAVAAAAAATTKYFVQHLKGNSRDHTIWCWHRSGRGGVGDAYTLAGPKPVPGMRRDEREREWHIIAEGICVRVSTIIRGSSKTL